MSLFSNSKINPFHGYFLCMSGTFSLSQISGIVILLEQAKRDALISSILGCIGYFFYTYWIYRIVRNLPPNQSFLDILERKMGKLVAWAVRWWIALYLFCELFVVHKNIVIWVKSMFLPFTPIWAISIPLLMVCTYLAIKGIKPIAISFSIFIPALLLLVVFMAVFTFKYRHYDIILPLFSEGVRPILEGTATVFRGCMDLFLLLLLSPYIQGQYKWKHFAAFWSLISIIIINSAAGLLTTFGPYEASKQRFPLFTQWRLVNISSFLEHLDFLSMYQWLSNTAVLISLGMFLFGDLLASKPLSKKIVILAFTTSLFICVELRINDTDFLYFTKTYFYPLSALSILFWTVLASFTSRKRGLS